MKTTVQQISDYILQGDALSNAAYEIVKRQNAAIDDACWWAIIHGLSVHIYPRSGPAYRWNGNLLSVPYIGIALEEGPVQIVWHEHRVG
jgi:hypothetical protein